MRSVSSANNLRKVHAKKEAERAEIEGRTPTSVRSLAGDEADDSHYGDGYGSRSVSPGSAAGGEGKDHADRHQALMSKIFPRGIDRLPGAATAERFFPRSVSAGGSDTVMKTEGDEDHVAEAPTTRQAPPPTAVENEDTPMTSAVQDSVESGSGASGADVETAIPGTTG